MILAFDIGNTNVAAGLFRPGAPLDPVSLWKLRRPRKAGKAWWKELVTLACAEAGIAPADLEGSSVCSVVPAASRDLSAVLKRITGKAPLLIRGGLPLGIAPSYARPDRLGPDRLCAMIAGARKYGLPLIVVDCGTAITVDGVSRAGKHIGGMIAPGLAASAAALGKSTAALPPAEWGVPRRAAGTDTIAGIRSGVWFGAVGGIRECVKRLKDVLGKSAAVAATGGDAPVLFESEEGLFDTLDTALVLEGAAVAWGMLKRKGRPTSRRPAGKR